MTRHPAHAVEQVVLAEAALAAARDTGVLDRLVEAPATPAGVAADLDLDPRLLGRTLDVLGALGIAEVDEGGRFHVDPLVEPFVAAASRYRRLPAALRGEPVGPSVDAAEGAAALYPGVVGLLGEVFAAAADEVAALLARPGIRVLDVGAGAAPWSLAIARREPDARVVALDLPEVVPATRTAVAVSGTDDRVRVLGGDVFGGALDEDLGGPFDVVLVANLCHLFDADRVGHLLSALATHVAGGGHLSVVDVLPDGTSSDPGLALYTLGLAMRTSTGGLHTRADYEQWLGAAGLGPVQLHRTSDGVAVLLGGQQVKASVAQGSSGSARRSSTSNEPASAR